MADAHDAIVLPESLSASYLDRTSLLRLDGRIPPVVQRRRLWLAARGVVPAEVWHATLLVGRECVFEQPSHVDRLLRFTAAGEILAAMAAYSGRSGVGIEATVGPEEAGLSATLQLWLSSATPPSEVALHIDLY